jgi:hypothetical protein
MVKDGKRRFRGTILFQLFDYRKFCEEKKLKDLMVSIHDHETPGNSIFVLVDLLTAGFFILFLFFFK